MNRHLVVKALHRDKSFLSRGADKLTERLIANNEEVVVRYLYELNFNPVLTIDIGIFEFSGMKVIVHKYYASIMSANEEIRNKYFFEIHNLADLIVTSYNEKIKKIRGLNMHRINSYVIEIDLPEAYDSAFISLNFSFLISEKKYLICILF